MIFLQHEKGWDNMLTKTRQKEILKLLENRGSVTLQELKDHLNTSESTIRRDLNTLDAQGKLVKVFGGAVAADNMSIRDEQVSRREEKNLEEKRLIARYAASLIQDDDFVYLRRICSMQSLPSRMSVFTGITASISRVSPVPQ